jgi:hypothetical protein
MSNTLARRTLRLALMAALQAVTGVEVESPGDWETPTDKLPEIKLRVSGERKASGARAAPTFTTTVGLELLARASASTGEGAQDAIEALGERIEAAVFTSLQLLGWLQQVSAVNSSTTITAAGKTHIAELRMLLDCEVFESFEVDPDTLGRLQELQLTVDTAAPFDRAGTYSNPAFPQAVTAAPRTSGPDGRAEGGLHIHFPT